MQRDHAELVAQLQQQYGAGTISIGGHIEPTEAISTGSILVDEAIGIGGVARGRVTEIYGVESSGKSTMAIHIMANAMNGGGDAAYIDAEHAMDGEYAARCGLDMDRVIISQPDSAEDALNIADRLVESGQLDVVVLDSVAALVPEAEMENDIGKSAIGVQARLMSQTLRKMTANISKTKTAMIFINQMRQKIGVTFGDPNVTSGGMALKYYASTRLDLRRVAWVKAGEEVIGARIRAKVAKNKVARPWTTAEFEILYDQGISRAGEVLDLGVKLDVIEKNGTRYYREGEYLGNGRNAARLHLMEQRSTLDEAESLIRAEIAKRKQSTGRGVANTTFTEHEGEEGDGQSAASA